VLAGGGIVGGLYEIGALLALDACFDGFNTRDFDLYIGSSAGAFVAALLANGVSPDRIRQTLESDRGTLPRLTGAQFLSLPWRAHLATLPRLAAALPRVARDLWVHWRDALVLDTLGSLLRHLPHGLFTLDGLEAYVRHALSHGGRSNDFRRLRRRLLVPATELDTGSVHVFGFSRDDPTPVSAAVAASAAVPLLYEPVQIDGTDYVDAAITKTAHAGLALDLGVDLVVLVNPIRPLVLEPGAPIRSRGMLAIVNQALRIALNRRLHDGMGRYADEHPYADVVLLEPYVRDLQLFETPLMTYSLRHEVVRRGYRTTVKTILADLDRLAFLFARHGIAILPRDEIERRASRWSSAQVAAEASAAAAACAPPAPEPRAEHA
jgi:predicted acylesterase/phospholipase RssA